jgi:hypothetical protein
MAITKGTNITAIDSDDPFNFIDAGNLGGVMRVSMDARACAADDLNADGDAVLLAQVPSNARITSVRVYNDDLDSGSSSSVNIGVYNGAEEFNDTDGSQTLYAADAVIDEDCFTAASGALQSAGGTELAFGTAARKAAPLVSVWEDAGLTSDPGVPLRIGITQTATVSGAQAGDVTMIVTYVVD